MKNKQAHQGEHPSGNRGEESTPGASGSEKKSSLIERASKAELYSRYGKVSDSDSKAKHAQS